MDTTSTKRSGLAYFSGAAIVLGILGFIPGITHNYHLFWLAQVGPWFNTLYIVAGVIGLIAASGTERVADGFAKLFTVVFALWAIIGLFVGDGQVLGFVENNYWSVVLNAIMTIGIAAVGFSTSMAMESRRTGAVAFGEYQRDHKDQ